MGSSSGITDFDNGLDALLRIPGYSLPLAPMPSTITGGPISGLYPSPSTGTGMPYTPAPYTPASVPLPPLVSTVDVSVAPLNTELEKVELIRDSRTEDVIIRFAARIHGPLGSLGPLSGDLVITPELLNEMIAMFYPDGVATEVGAAIDAAILGLE